MRRECGASIHLRGALSGGQIWPSGHWALSYNNAALPADMRAGRDTSINVGLLVG